MRAELVPPQVTDDWDALIEQAYERLEAGDSSALVAEKLSVALGYAVDAGWLDGVFGSVSAVEAAWQLRVDGIHSWCEKFDRRDRNWSRLCSGSC